MKPLPLLLALASTLVSVAAAEFEVAEWIAPPSDTGTNRPLPLFRKEFMLARKPERAVLRIIGLGDYHPSLNGEPLTSIGIHQPWSQYEKTLYFRDFDVTKRLHQGSNCVGVMLGNSFWHNPNPPAGRYNKDGPQRIASEPLLLRAELRLESSGGRQETIGTDASWASAPGPLTFSHVYAGEDFDARLQQDGWNKPGFHAVGWRPARIASSPPGELRPTSFPAVEQFGIDRPVSVSRCGSNVYLYTFPRNTAAQLRLKLAGGKSGDRVQFRCGEHKKDDGLFGAYIVGCEVTTDGQLLDHQWAFFYLGMQFVEVTGAVPEGEPNPDKLPVVRELELVTVRAALPEVGKFQSSSSLYNNTHRIIDQAMQANMNWVMTDCPHREKLGWLECAYLMAPSFLYRYDGREWFAKIAGDIRDAQEPSGRVTTVAPSYPAGRFPGAFTWTVEWGAAAVLVPWSHYQWFGDAGILRTNYKMMRRFTDYIATEAHDGLAPGGLGDWYDYGHGQPPGPSRYTPVVLSATATWGLCALTLSEAAEVLGKSGDARKYRELHQRIAADFQRHFQDPSTRLLKHKGSPQCANSMALCAHVVSDADGPRLIEDTVADLEERGWQQTPGDVGHVYFIRALAEAGRSDVLHRVYSRDGLGSYGGILAKGLTSLPETWDAMMDGYQSLNHCMLGHVMEWYYGYVAGIRQEPGSAGWRRVLIAPQPGPLKSAEAEVKTPRGKIASRWHRESGEFVLEVEVPEGVQATAILPSGRSEVLAHGSHVLRERESSDR